MGKKNSMVLMLANAIYEFHFAPVEKLLRKFVANLTTG